MDNNECKVCGKWLSIAESHPKAKAQGLCDVCYGDQAIACCNAFLDWETERRLVTTEGLTKVFDRIKQLALKATGRKNEC